MPVLLLLNRVAAAMWCRCETVREREREIFTCVMRSWSRAGGGGLRRGRQSVAHGGVAAAADVRAVDEGEISFPLPTHLAFG